MVNAMTLDEILPFLLIFNTIISVCTLWYVICISTDINRNHFSLDNRLSMIYQYLLIRFDKMLGKKARTENDEDRES